MNYGDFLMSVIHSTAIVSDKSFIGSNVTIGAYCVIEDNVHICDQVEIEPFSYIGITTSNKQIDNKSNILKINSHTTIKSHAKIYQSTEIGKNCFIGHSAIIRENSILKNNVQIGNNSEIQGDVVIDHDSKLQSNVFVSKFSNIGRYVWVLPGATLLNDKTPPSHNLLGPCLDDFSVIGANSTIMPNIKIAFGTLIGSGSLVMSDTKPLSVYYGSPAKYVSTLDEFNRKHKSRLFPWFLRFDKNYDKKELIRIYEDNITKIY
jgi:acetyltransferase-like isoleucine patch superfamily enzyme